MNHATKCATPRQIDKAMLNAGRKEKEGTRKREERREPSLAGLTRDTFSLEREGINTRCMFGKWWVTPRGE